MGRAITLTLISGFILIICSCENEVITKTDEVSLMGEWKLVAFDTLGKETYYVDPQDTIVINFLEDNIISGISKGLCVNSFSGKYYFTDINMINITDVISTRAVCPQSSYWQFVSGLAEVDRFELSNQLHLYNDKNHTKIILKRERPKQ